MSRPTPSGQPQPAKPAVYDGETLAAGGVAAETGGPAHATVTPPVPRSLVGKTLGDFELLEEVGRGGMGVVYKARQVSLERPVALKMLLAEHLLTPERLARFLAEARIMAGLAHPNIVNIYQIGQCDYGHYFAMEYIEGQTLDAVIQEKSQAPVPWSVSLMVLVGEAVQHAHAKGFVHRDLKPSNIMIDRLRRPVVMDFGIAKFLGRASALTREGTIMGTPAFMAPEQASDDLVPVGPHSDVYSLGAILYMLLAGRPPYDEETPLRTILKVIAEAPPPPVRSLRPEVPAELDRICMKCLAKRPADRYPTAQAFVDALRRFRSAPAKTMEMTPLEVVLTVEETGKEVRLRKPITLVGRAPECNIVLKASDVSKNHCQILVDSAQVLVEDLGSANGTFVNGKPVKKARLRDGDELAIADHLLHVRIAEPEEATGERPA